MTNKPAQVTEAHLHAAANALGFKTVADANYWGNCSDMQKIDKIAQLIADREARAIARVVDPSTSHPEELKMRVEYHADDNRIYAYSLDGKFLWSGCAWFNTVECVRLTAERDQLRAKIGTRPLGSHPDEQHPRAQTWHQERLNWISEVVQLRDEVERLKACVGLRRMQDAVARAERAEAELAKERARLDWLETQCPHIYWSANSNHPEKPTGTCAVSTGPGVVFYRNTYRDAIDAAMKEESK